MCSPSHRHRLTSTQMQSQQDVRRRGGKGFHIMCSQVIIVGFIVSSVIPLISLSPFPRTPLVITSLFLYLSLTSLSGISPNSGAWSEKQRQEMSEPLEMFSQDASRSFLSPAIIRTASSPTDTGTMIRDDDG